MCVGVGQGQAALFELAAARTTSCSGYGSGATSTVSSTPTTARPELKEQVDGEELVVPARLVEDADALLAALDDG